MHAPSHLHLLHLPLLVDDEIYQDGALNAVVNGILGDI